MPDLVVTTSRSVSGTRLAEAAAWAERLGAPLVDRADLRLAALAAAHGVAGVLVVGGDRVAYYEPARDLTYFYHPGMARTRVRNLQSGRGDPLVTALRLQPGDRVLDCTLGRATDAIVASWVVGPAGRVVGLEKMPLLACLTVEGLQHYQIAPPDLEAAMRRVEAHRADYHDFLPAQPDGAFEVVYFDPLFDRPVEASSGMAPLRPLASPEPVTAAAVHEALRVARRCVGIKQRRASPLWADLPFPVTLISGGHSTIEYGVVEAL